MKNLVLTNPEFKSKLTRFELRLKQQGRSETTTSSCVNLSREFLHYQHGKGLESLKEIDQTTLDKYFDYLVNVRMNQRTGLPLSFDYINKHREAILRFLEFLTDAKVGESNYIIKYLKADDRKLKQVLSKDEMQKLFNTCDNTLAGITDKCLLTLLYGCGMRLGEVHTLEVNEIDFTKGLIRLDKTKTKCERDVVMSPSVKRSLEEFLYSARNMMLPTGSTESYLMVTERGQQMNIGTITWRLNRMSKRAGLNRKISPHLLRHSIATELMEDLTLEEIADFLGQKCLDSTQIYTRIKQELL